MKIVLVATALFMQLILVSPTFGGEKLEDRADYLADVQSYAICTVRNYNKSARDMILSNVDNKSMGRKFGDIYTEEALAFVPNCRELVLNYRSIIVEPDALRASIAQVLVKKYFSDGAAADFSDVTPLIHLQPENIEEYNEKIKAAKFEKQRARIKKVYDEDVSRSWLSAFGECVVRFDTSNSRELVISKLGSPAELNAISLIKPALSSCLVDGELLTLDKYTLRGTLAINYYRLAMANGSISKASSD